MYNECKSCMSYADNNNHVCQAGVRPQIGTQECPCRSCLVKVMCVQPCESLKKYREAAYRAGL